MTRKRPLLPVLIAGIALLSACASPGGQAPDTAPPDETSPSDVAGRPIIFQEGNELPRTQLQPKQSPELEDNRMGIHAHALWNPAGQGVFPDGVLDAGYILKLGAKHARLAIKSLDAPDDPNVLIDMAEGEPEFSIEPSHDDFINSLAENGVTIRYVLSFWDAEYAAQGGEVPSPRFKTEGEMERYLDFVRFIVRHFKDRIEYYEIWNEPTCVGKIQHIEVGDYIKLVKRAVPVIRQEYPGAKIVVGGPHNLIECDAQDYLFAILRSDVMPLVDVVSWHPMYGTSPEDRYHANGESISEYYYEYPYLVQEIKDVASAHGFEGEYVGDELNYLVPEQVWPEDRFWFPAYSESKCAKYYARGIVMHLGMDVSVTTILPRETPQVFHTIQNLCTVMAGNRPIGLAIEIEMDMESQATDIKGYSFSLPDGDKLVALWTDGVAVDDDPGVEATVTLSGLSAKKVMGIDVLNGFEQELVTGVEEGSLVIRGLLVKDYPTILRVT